MNFLFPVGLKSSSYAWHQGVVRYCSVESIHPSEAHHKKLRESWKHLDVRTKEEFTAGHAKDSICVPIMVKGKEGKLEENLSFLQDVCKFFKKDDKILVSCLKGPRAMKAIEKLREAGFSQVLNVAGGFEKWQESALPIEK
ncbi:Senescence-associated protein DIN1 [Galdieria sulphuraria]|nr:Senescence-associated protein DIN1 [Galdieria sulphuraria]